MLAKKKHTKAIRVSEERRLGKLYHHPVLTKTRGRPHEGKGRSSRGQTHVVTKTKREKYDARAAPALSDRHKPKSAIRLLCANDRFGIVLATDNLYNPATYPARNGKTTGLFRYRERMERHLKTHGKHRKIAECRSVPHS